MTRCAALAAVLVLAFGTSRAEGALRPPIAPPATFPYGVAWYPEWFAESTWDAELVQMHDAHVTFVRVAEFSWSTLEPKEGEYDFTWLDHAIAHAAAHGIKVVVGTPTAAPPAWLTSRYPQVLAVNADGSHTHHGWRRQFSVGSALYRQKAAAIAAQMARRYGRNPDVIGFQIDNEYGRETFDEETRGRFQTWMQANYGTLAALNKAYFGAYWSLDYTDWSQIHIPRKDDQPQLYVDWLRAFSDMWRDYQRDQLDAMKPYLGADKVVTANYVAKYDEFDFSTPAQDLNLVSWDWYFDDPRIDPADGAMQHDLYRGFLQRNPWVMETAPGHQTAFGNAYMQPRGQTRAMTWQAIGHGADGYAFWLWRVPLNGTETEHGSLLDASGRPMPIFLEIAQAGEEIAKAWPALRGTTPVADAAILYDYPSRWNIERHPMSATYDVWKEFVRYRRALAPVTQDVDVRMKAQDLSRYPLVVAPAMSLMSEDTARTLDAYVRGGGHLVLGPRSGEKHGDGDLWRPGQLGPLEADLGARIDISLPPSRPAPVTGPLGSGTATAWAARAAAGQGRRGPAVLRPGGRLARRRPRRGQPQGGSRQDHLHRRRARRAAPGQGDRLGGRTGEGGAPVAGHPHVEVDARRKAGRTVYVAINWAETARTVPLPAPMPDLLHGGVVKAVSLEPFGVAVLDGGAR